MKDKFYLQPNEAEKKVIKEHIIDIIDNYGGYNKTTKHLGLSRGALWNWLNFNQPLQPQHAFYIVKRCDFCDIFKLIPQYKKIIKKYLK